MRLLQSSEPEPEPEMAKCWGYTGCNGPNTWAASFPDAAGSAQSPVNICCTEAIYDNALKASPLTTKYTPEESFEAINTGESFKVNIKATSELTGGPLTDVYRLEQFHLHWGSADDHGSEHTIDGKTFAAELHLVHYNSTKYASFAEAVDKPDGLAVLGIMIQSGSEHPGFKDLVDTMRNIKQGGQSCTVLKSFDPATLLPENMGDYWTYHGSLTTPPCYESVQWIVLKQSVQYSPQQLQALRTLLNNEGCDCIQDNFRPPLPLGDRKIRSSFTDIIDERL